MEMNAFFRLPKTLNYFSENILAEVPSTTLSYDRHSNLSMVEEDLTERIGSPGTQTPPESLNNHNPNN